MGKQLEKESEDEILSDGRDPLESDDSLKDRILGDRGKNKKKKEAKKKKKSRVESPRVISDDEKGGLLGEAPGQFIDLEDYEEKQEMPAINDDIPFGATGIIPAGTKPEIQDMGMIQPPTKKKNDKKYTPTESSHDSEYTYDSYTHSSRSYLTDSSSEEERRKKKKKKKDE